MKSTVFLNKIQIIRSLFRARIKVGRTLGFRTREGIYYKHNLSWVLSGYYKAKKIYCREIRLPDQNKTKKNNKVFSVCGKSNLYSFPLQRPHKQSCIYLLSSPYCIMP